MDNPPERPPLPSGPPPPTGLPLLSEPPPPIGPLPPSGPPPNFPWGGQPNPNWGFIPPNFPPPPPPSWPLPFPPPLPTAGFPPPLLPPAGALSFRVPPPPLHFPPPPGPPPGGFGTSLTCGPVLPPPLAETTESLPKTNLEASQTTSKDVLSADNKPDTNTEAKANTSSHNADSQPSKNSDKGKDPKPDTFQKEKDTTKKTASSVRKRGDREQSSCSDKRRDREQSLCSDKRRDREQSSCSDKRRDREPTPSLRDRRRSSRGLEQDERRNKGHQQSHRSRSRDSPPRHSSHRERDSRERRYDRETRPRHGDRHSRSPSFSRHDRDRISRSAAYRDHERRIKYHSLEYHHSRRHSQTKSRSRSPIRKREGCEKKESGHSKPKATSEAVKKTSLKSSSEDQSRKDILAESSDKASCNIDKTNKCVNAEVDCKDDRKTNGKPSKEKRQKPKDDQKDKEGPKHSDSEIIHRYIVSKPEKEYHISPHRLHSRPNRKSRRSKQEEEDQPALSTVPSKHITCTTAEEFYAKPDENSPVVVATDALKELHQKFQKELVERAGKVRALKPKYEPPVRKTKLRKHKPPEAHCSDDSSCSEQESSSEDEDTALEELERKRQHPDRLHPELWFNDPREMNDGPLCRCSAKSRRSGIRHGIYVGETHLPSCDPFSNNAKRLHHYKIAVTPVTNFLTKSPTVITHAGQKYIFEGFSLLSHRPIPEKLPPCKVIRFNYEYTVLAVAEPMPFHFTVAGLELLGHFLLNELLELADLDWRAHEDTEGCPIFHFFPRFARVCDDDSKELLSLNVILDYLLASNELLVPTSKLDNVNKVSDDCWQSTADKVKGMIVTSPGMKPSAVRVDQLDREHIDSQLDPDYPVIVHFGVRPPQLSYAGNPEYQKAWRDYVKYRHLLANKPKVSYADRHKLLKKETKLQEMRMENDLKRDVTVVISSKGFYKTGIMSDIIQHAMLLPILVCHLRFHDSLGNLEETIGYKFKDRFLLQLALTHPSYRENFGTNPDHARNSLTNCGLRQPQYGDRRIHYMNTRKRGINTLINIMSRFGMQRESASSIHHNERLEFLGDAVVEFLSSIHLFYLFPDLEEGGLATYRAAIVQNQHLAVLSKKLHLEKFMLYAHGSDLCHDLELRHAMANCFEALMGALFLDGGIEVADKVFSKTLFPEKELQEVWKNYPLHPLQEQEPDGDRKWIDSVPLLQKLHEFEEQIGIEFTHIRLLARALTHRSLGYNNLTLGSNQRLEFLGDTVLQLVASEYLYKFFPQHHEGHLSLLRSSIVNNRTQAVVCRDLGMTDYAIYPYFKVELKPKDKADLLEAFLGALYVDKDLGYCQKFCEVCFFPRLQDFIMNQDWNDPKSKLQQCCLTLRSMDGGEPDIPTYKVIECKGPTNTRVYAVAVYFQGSRLAVGSGHSIQQAEMDAANNALMKSQDLFPQLKHQKRAIERSLKQGSSRRSKYSSSRKERRHER